MNTQDENHPTQAVFENVIARPVIKPDLQHGRLVHLSWSAPMQGERLVQWYLDGEWAGCSSSYADRSAWLLLDASRPQEIELLAVAAGDAITPMPGLLAGAHPPTRPAIGIALLRDASLPLGARVSIVVDGVSTDSAPLFGADTPRGGFGAVFGEGGFGYDASTGPGLGLGVLGDGPLGAGGAALRWRHRSLGPGAHRVTLSAADADGLPAAEDQTLEMITTRLPAPPEQPTLGSDLQLTWT